MKASDGLLAIEVSRMEGISFREASAEIAEEVEKINSLLSDKKTVEIGTLGILQKSDEGKIIFHPSHSGHSAPANFGLDTLHYSPTQAEPERRIVSFTIPSARRIARYAAIGVLAAGMFLAAPQLNDAAKNLANLFPVKQSSNTTVKALPIPNR